MQGCRTRLLGKPAGQGCRARLHAMAQYAEQRAESMVKLVENAVFWLMPQEVQQKEQQEEEQQQSNT
jgi:hypothetical protein